MDNREQFIADLYPAARRVSQDTGMSAELMLTQAALESHWGEQVVPGTHNVFNVKADERWDGPRQALNVAQYVDGKRVMVEQDFRVYGSIEEALRDRVDSLRNNPRYAEAGLFDEGTKGDFGREADALQRAGYATDPQYARQLAAVFDGPTMQHALQLSRDQARGECVQVDPSMQAKQPTEAGGTFVTQPTTSITDVAHPNHTLFEDVSRRIAEQTGQLPRPEVAANVVLQMLESGVRVPGDIRGFVVTGSNAHVQGATPGVRVSVDLWAPTASLPAISEHMIQFTRELAAEEQTRQPNQPLGPTLP